ncbi:MAG: hypothetical protein LBT09_02515 [Planctomycetaceae bacterium]|jgi:hypothetical protein|nr:hypothetical protein [Planctomycetaceae bacterium]
MKQKIDYRIFRYRVISLFLLFVILCLLITLLVQRSIIDRLTAVKDHEISVVDNRRPYKVKENDLDSVYLCNKDDYDKRRILFCTMAPDMDIFDRHPPYPIDAYLSVMRKTRSVNKALFWADNIVIEHDGELSPDDIQRQRYNFRALAFEMGKEYKEAIECYKIYYNINDNKIEELIPPRVLYFIGKRNIAAKRYVNEIQKLSELLQMESLDERDRIDEFCQDIFWNKYDVPEPCESFEEYIELIKNNISPANVEDKNKIAAAIKLLTDLINIRNINKLKCIGPYNKYPYDGYFTIKNDTQ